MSSLGAVVADFFFLGPLGLLGISLKMSPESPNKSSSPSGFTTFFGFRASVFLTENNSSSSSWKQLTNELKSNLRGNSYYSRIIHTKKKKTFQLLIRNVVTNMTYKSVSQNGNLQITRHQKHRKTTQRHIWTKTFWVRCECHIWWTPFKQDQEKLELRKYKFHYKIFAKCFENIFLSMSTWWRKI